MSARNDSGQTSLTRSGQFDLSVKQEEPTSVDNAAVIDVSDESSDATESSADTTSGSDEEATNGSHAARLVSCPKAPQGTSLKQHKKSRMLHLVQDGYQKTMMCGRRCTDVYAAPSQVRWDTPCCSHCWRAARAL